MKGLKSLLRAGITLVFLASIIGSALSIYVPKKAMAMGWEDAYCWYEGEPEPQDCVVDVLLEAGGKKTGYSLHEGKWYLCVQLNSDTNIFSCTVIKDDDIRRTYRCGPSIENEAYTDFAGVRWICTRIFGGYYWITYQQNAIPPCNEHNHGRIWSPGDGGTYYICVFKDGKWQWDLIETGLPYRPSPYALPRFYPNPGVIIIEDAGDSNNSIPSRFKWNAGSGAGLVDKFKIWGNGTVLSTLAATSGTDLYTFDTITYPSINSFQVTAYKPDGSGYYIGEANLPSREPLVKSKPGNMAVTAGTTTYTTNQTAHQIVWYNGDSTITKFEVFRNGYSLGSFAPKPLGWDNYTDTLPRPTSTTPAKYYYSVIAYRGTATPVGLQHFYEFNLSTAPTRPQYLAPIMYQNYCPNPNIGISWGASSDDGGVTGYNVYRDGTKIATVTQTYYTDYGVRCPTGSDYGTFRYAVSAVDGEGSESAKVELTVNATPYAPPPPDDGCCYGDM